MSDLEDNLAQVTEKQFSQTVVDAAKRFGWLFYRTWNSQHSPAGFPDLCMVRGNRLIFAELKRQAAKSKLSPSQWEWFVALGDVEGIEVYVWRPQDFELIVKILR